jgi:hypothetical protein
MSCEKAIEPNGIWCRYFGSVTGNEIDQIAESIRVDANLSTMRYVIADFIDFGDRRYYFDAE